MKKITQIRWHGRGGQGVKVASSLLAECALEEGKWSQGFPDYGPERRGAPIRGFNRISGERIDLHCPITEPDIVLVVDDTLIRKIDVCAGLGKEGLCIINSPCDPSVARAKLNMSGGKVCTVDATKISRDVLGRPVPNTAMMGALCKASGVLKLDTVIKQVGKIFEKKYGKAVADKNLEAIRRAYAEVKCE